MDREAYRYQKFCSDIAGQDVNAHAGDPLAVIPVVRNWLRAATHEQGVIIPGGVRMAERYQVFTEDMPEMCEELHLEPSDLIFTDFATLVVSWIQVNEW